MAKVRKDNRGRNLHKGEYQRPDGRYAYAYTYNGKRVFVYDMDLANLRLKEKRIQADLIDGIRTCESARLTLNDIFQEYMQTKINLKKSTYANYLYLWKKYVQDEPVAKKPLAQIHKSDILLLYTKLLRQGFACNSLESINNLIHPTLELALDDDLIRKNPSKGVYHSLKTNNAVQHIALTPEQTQKFLHFVEESPVYHNWLPLLVTLLGTGIRVSECAGLVWDNVDLNRHCITIDHSLVYRVLDGHAGYYISSPKTKNSVRTIPMVSQVETQLMLLREEQNHNPPHSDLTLDGYCGFVFRNRFGQFVNAHGIDRAIDRICTSINDEESVRAEKENRKPELLPHITAHTLRHTFCTRLCEHEKDLAVIQHLMGHSDIETTLTIYDHISQSRLKQVVDALDAKNIFCLP